MSQLDQNQVQTLFQELVELDRTERKVYLDQVCGDQPILRAELETLIAHHDHLTGFEPGSGRQGQLDEIYTAGKRMGAYRLIRQLGHGSMGVVYLAERADEMYAKQVAIKLINAHRSDAAMTVRFQNERQILADLEHPNIARLLDAGISDQGTPFYVMEYVEGQSLNDYCRQHQLTIKQRLRLFQKICKAVDVAHQNLIIHRDIKPGNILVTDEGIPKLLDFGIAKPLNAQLEAMQTQVGTRLMTPAYASPEQVQSATLTTRSDVFSLGAVLYELLADKRPFAEYEGNPLELEAAICEKKPLPPSSHHSLIDRDLDTITLQALHKDPNHRYQSVQQLSADIERYLQSIPVQARGDSWGYVTSKFIRRHAVGVAVAVVVAMVILGAVLVAFSQRQTALVERQLALAERDIAKQTEQFMLDLFELSDPGEARGNSVTVREVLDRGAGQIQGLHEQPLVQARLLNTMGQVYSNLGLYEKAQLLLEQTLAIRQQQVGMKNLETAETQNALGTLFWQKGDYQAAEPLFRQSLATRRELLGAKHPDVAASMNDLGGLFYYQGDVEAAEPLFRESLVMQRQLLGQQHPDIAENLNALALLLHGNGEHAAAEPLYREALAMYRELWGELHPDINMAMNNLARVLQDQGNYAEAEPLFRQVLEMDWQLHGEEHPDIAIGLNNLGNVLRDQGNFAAAEPLYQQTLAMSRKLLGEDHIDIAVYTSNLASLQQHYKKDYKEAERLYRQALRLDRKWLDEEHVYIAISLSNIADTLRMQHRYQEAAPMLQQALTIFQKALPEDHWRPAVAKHVLGATLGGLGSFEEGESLMLPTFARIQEATGAQSFQTKIALQRLIDFYELWDKSQQVEKYQALLSAK